MVVIQVQNSAPLQIVAVLPQGALLIWPFLQVADSEFLVLAIEIRLVARLMAEAVEVALVVVVVEAVDVPLVGYLEAVLLDLGVVVVVVVPSFSALPKAILVGLELGAEAVDVSLVARSSGEGGAAVAEVPRLQANLGGVVMVEVSPFSEIVNLGLMVVVVKVSIYRVHLSSTNLVPGWAPAAQVAAANSMLMQASARDSYPLTRILMSQGTQVHAALVRNPVMPRLGQRSSQRKDNAPRWIKSHCDGFGTTEMRRMRTRKIARLANDVYADAWAYVVSDEDQPS